MTTPLKKKKLNRNVSQRGVAIWRVIQILVWSAGMFIWGALLLKPELGLHLLWNTLIPVAPALFVIAPGFWRNVCPLGSMSLMPHHLKLSQHRPLFPVWRGRLFLCAFLLLIIVVPLRKAFLDTNGPLLAVVLAAVGILAITLGMFFDQKSAWCSSLCPVYPVELLYGSQPLVSVPNVHCPRCSNCVAPCSESSSSMTPTTAINTKLGKLTGTLLIGLFPGFVWGWYNVKTYHNWEGLSHLHLIYGLPFTAGITTLALYLILCKVLVSNRALIDSLFASAAIIIYYWFRLPPVLGFGDNPDLAIINLTQILPEWTPHLLRLLEILFFSIIMVGRFGKKRSWETHPVSSEKLTQLT